MSLYMVSKSQSPYYMLYVNKDTAQVGDVVKIVATDGNFYTVNCPSANVSINFESYNNQNLYTLVAGTWQSNEVNDSIIHYWTVQTGTAVGMGVFSFYGGSASCQPPSTPTFSVYIKAGTAASIQAYNNDKRLINTSYYNMMGEQTDTLQSGVIYVCMCTYSDGSRSVKKVVTE